ncbi:MAG TPA: FAD-binding oxidoreductase [Thermodesulfobacteriota bacterium]
MANSNVTNSKGNKVQDKTIEEFKSKLRGELIRRGDEQYDEARKVYNAMIDKKPGLIARCVDAADVISAVNFARDNDMLVSIRGGGHNVGGFGICNDGLAIDLSPIKYTRLDPSERTVRVGAGCTWGDVDHATHQFGLAIPAGIISTTGVAGLTLGGGVGHLTRKCGLTIDNLLAADMVLADGSFVTVSEEENQELYWAIRGGGGNFGVITSFLFKSHPVSTVHAGPMIWELDQTTEVMQWYREFIIDAPEDINGFFLFLVVPPGPPFPEHLHGKNMCGVVWCYTGPKEKVEEVFKPIRRISKPAFVHVGPMPLPVLNSAFDALYPKGLQQYWKADFMNELSDEAIAQHVKYGSKVPTMLSTMHIYPINGAAHRVGKNDTPWIYRDATWAQVIVGVDPDPANNEKIISWTREYWDVLHEHSAGGAYVNFMMEEGEDRIRATYGDNYERLVSIKNKYDPSNLFRVNQNIKPTV